LPFNLRISSNQTDVSALGHGHISSFGFRVGAAEGLSSVVFSSSFLFFVVNLP
jgi:hypothetical protein